MALSDISFKIYTDGSLSTLFVDPNITTHETDFSDNPQDFQFFLGSTIADRKIEATSNPGVDNITLTPTVLRAEWVTVTAYSLGDSIEPTTPNGLRYEATTAGTSAAGEPTFPTGAVGDTVADGTVVWTYVSAAHPVTEIKIATLQGGLAGASGGAALSVGTSVTSEAANKFEFWMRITNTVSDPSDTLSFPGIGINVNEIVETAV